MGGSRLSVLSLTGKWLIFDKCFDICEYCCQLKFHQNCFFNHPLTSLIILSHIPSIYGAAGGLKYQAIFFLLDEYLMICCIGCSVCL